MSTEKEETVNITMMALLVLFSIVDLISLLWFFDSLSGNRKTIVFLLVWIELFAGIGAYSRKLNMTYLVLSLFGLLCSLYLIYLLVTPAHEIYWEPVILRLPVAGCFMGYLVMNIHQIAKSKNIRG